MTTPGNCASTNRIYVVVQDGVPVTYGMKFSNVQASHFWNLETAAAAQYGEAWLAAGNNTIIGEHVYTNQTVQIVEYSDGNKHLNAFFDGPALFGAAIYSHTGLFENATFPWDGPAYPAASGY